MLLIRLGAYFFPQLGNKSDLDGHASVDELISALYVSPCFGDRLGRHIGMETKSLCMYPGSLTKSKDEQFR